MGTPAPQPAAAPRAVQAAPTGAITPQQVQEAAAAAFEVLNGAPSNRVLELAERISIAKALLREIAAGSLVVGQRPPSTRPATPAAAPAPNRKERRSARHRA